jgi:Tol biopolymer transport system component
MGATGESARRLTSFGYNPAWSPDGRAIVFATEGVENPMVRKQDSHLWMVDVASGRTHQLGAADAVQPSWSPHGQRIAYWGVPSGGARVVWTIPAAGGEPVQVTRDEHVNWNPVWAPGGQALYFVSDRNGSMNIWKVAIDEDSGKPQGEPEPVTSSSGSIGLLSLSRDGRRMVYASDEDKANLERRPLEPVALEAGGEASPVTQGSRAVRSAAVSPDGAWIAFDTYQPQEDLFVIRPDGSGLRQLTDDRAKDRLPRWWSDGSRILFYSDRGGGYGAWTIRPDASGLQPIPHGSREPLYNPIVSPDGRRLAASLGTETAVLLDLAQPPGRRLSRLPPPADAREVFSASDWSPDGRLLAGTFEESSIVVFSLGSGKYEKVGPAGAVPIFLHDGRTLLYRREGKIFLCDLAGKAPRPLLVPPPNSAFTAVTVSPDDRTLYTVRRTDEGDVWLLTFEGEEGAPVS